MNKLPDIELWDCIKQGNALAFDELYLRYWDKLYKICYWHLLDEDAAKDVVQELFINLWLRKEAIQISQTVDGYLKVAVRNRILNFIKSSTARQRRYQNMAKMLQQEDREVEAAVDPKVRELYVNEIEKLPQKMKNVFLLNKVYGFSNGEIAEKLSLSEQTVKNQLVTATKRIRDKMKHIWSF